MYCDRQNERIKIQSVVPIGSVVGMLLINFLSEVKGRKVALILCQIAAIIGMYCKNQVI